VTKTVENPSRRDSTYRVGLVDIDAKAGFLPRLVEEANRCQTYYSFRVIYLPVPAGYVRTIEDTPQTYVPSIAEYLVQKRIELGEDYLCCLTKNLVAGNGYWNYFASAHETGGSVSCISTYNLREYAQEARTSFAKACLCLCMSMLLMGDPRWGLEPHEKTHGCFFDLLINRHDIVVGLKKMKFDHLTCRHRIHDPEQLTAIDALLALRDANT
jgi:hypothetical protein